MAPLIIGISWCWGSLCAYKSDGFDCCCVGMYVFALDVARISRFGFAYHVAYCAFEIIWIWWWIVSVLGLVVLFDMGVHFLSSSFSLLDEVVAERALPVI